jgi:hypothetical protein
MRTTAAQYPLFLLTLGSISLFLLLLFFNSFIFSTFFTGNPRLLDNKFVIPVEESRQQPATKNRQKPPRVSVPRKALKVKEKLICSLLFFFSLERTPLP